MWLFTIEDIFGGKPTMADGPFTRSETSLAELVSYAVSEIAIKCEAEDHNEKLNENQDQLSYAEQLKDKRWHAFREFVFEVRGRRCEMCGAERNLQVHHPIYKNRNAWEYSYHEVMVLCRDCHERIHGLR